MNRLLASVIISVALIVVFVRVERATDDSTGVIISNRSIRKLAMIGIIVCAVALATVAAWALITR